MLASLTIQRKDQLLQEIQLLKQQGNAVILAHVYERLEVQDVADYCGDSLGLSQQAASTKAETIIFCGVHFMAETAKLLSPEKTVILANPNAGCPMADMITAEQLRTFKAAYPGVPVVGYVNTSAEVKAECDICCTSSNAIDVVASLNVSEVLFVPDKHLGAYVQEHLPEVHIRCWDGFCPTHLRLDLADLLRLKEQQPKAMVLVHPECDEPLKALADYIGSTTGIIDFAYKSQASSFIVCTEEGVAQRLSSELPHKQFITPSREQALCPNMKMTRLENIKKALSGLVAPVTLDPQVANKAKQAIERMLLVPTKGLGHSLSGGSSAACRCKSTPKAVASI
jgi:quinolinate synthase